MTRSPYDRVQARSQFSSSLANLVEFHAYWSPAAGRWFARSARRGTPDEARAAARGASALPPDAKFIGTYSDNAGAGVFLRDLDDAIAELAAVARDI